MCKQTAEWFKTFFLLRPQLQIMWTCMCAIFFQLTEEFHLKFILGHFSPHPTFVTCTAMEIFTSIHKTAALPPTATEYFSFPLKEMRTKGFFWKVATQVSERSVAKLACLSDGCRVRIGNKKKKCWENVRMEQISAAIEKLQRQPYQLIQVSVSAFMSKCLKKTLLVFYPPGLQCLFFQKPSRF